MRADTEFVLPTSYNYLLQGALYSSISPDLARFLHEEGFLVGQRHFKLFTFSRLQGKYILDRRSRSFIYSSNFSLQISSPIDRFVEELANTILKMGKIMIGGQSVNVTEMHFPKPPQIGDVVLVKTLSPVTIYSTLLTPEGHKKTYYYSPYEREFSELLNRNANKKLSLLKKEEIKSTLSTKPVKVKEVVTSYKGTIIKGWIGTFLLKGSANLIKAVYESGLGAKNSQGFGMIEVLECSAQ